MTQTDALNLEFKLTEDELLEFGKFAACLPAFKRNWSFSGAIFGTASIVVVYLISKNFFQAVALGILFGLALRFLLIKSTSKPKVMDKQNNVLLNETSSISLDGDGIAIALSGNRHFYSWGNIRNLSETENLILVFIDEKSSYIIPKRAFSSHEQIKCVVSTYEEFQTNGNLKK